MRRLLAILLTLFAPAKSVAQETACVVIGALIACTTVEQLAAQTVQQSGTITPNHMARWVTNGVIADAGTAANPFISSIGAMPGPICVNSGPITGPYNALCMSATQTGGGQLSLYNYGGASGGFSFYQNGAVVDIPVVQLPVANNNATCFADSSGTLKSCGSAYLSNALTSTHIFVGNSLNQATDVALTGDASITNTGAWTNSKIGGVSPGVLYPLNVGTGLSSGGGNLNLANTAVTPATYGDATHVGQFTVDQQGRITSATTVAVNLPIDITGSTINVAPGDPLTGTFGVSKTINGVAVIGDQLNVGANTVRGFNFFQSFGSTSVLGSRIGAEFSLEQTSPTNAANSTRSYTALMAFATSDQGDGGTGIGSTAGNYWAFNPFIQLGAAAAFVTTAAGMELDTDLRSGSSVLDKWGINIVQFSTDAVSGSRNDAANAFVNQSGATGWTNLIQIGDGVNASPLKTTGSILSVKGSPTFANGIDLSGASSITGFAFKSPNFSVSGAGAMTLGAALGPTYGGTGLATVSQGDLLFGSASNTWAALAKNTTATRYLSNTGASNNPAWAQVALATGVSDYATGTWTPALTFATPGNLSVSYSTQTGTYTQIGRLVFYDFVIATSSFTFTTSSGNMQITGLPFTVAASNTGALNFSGITKAGYTQINNTPTAGQTYTQLNASGMGVGLAGVVPADTLSGGTIVLVGSGYYVK